MRALLFILGLSAAGATVAYYTMPAFKQKADDFLDDLIDIAKGKSTSPEHYKLTDEEAFAGFDHDACSFRSADGRFLRRYHDWNPDANFVS